MTLYFILTPLKLSLNPKYKKGNAFLTYLCSNPLQHAFTCSKSAKTVRKCLELEQVIVNFRLKMKSNIYGV